MPLIERIETTIWEGVDSTGFVFTRLSFPFIIPRRCVARIVRGSLILALGAAANTDDDISVFAMITNTRTNPAPGTIPNSASVAAQNGVLQVMAVQAAEGTPANASVTRIPMRAQRDFRMEPHRTAEIRSEGAASNADLGWSVIHWAITNTTVINIWSTLEIEIEYIEDAKPSPTVSHRRKVLVMNQ